MLSRALLSIPFRLRYNAHISRVVAVPCVLRRLSDIQFSVIDSKHLLSERLSSITADLNRHQAVQSERSMKQQKPANAHLFDALRILVRDGHIEYQESKESVLTTEEETLKKLPSALIGEDPRVILYCHAFLSELIQKRAFQNEDIIVVAKKVFLMLDGMCMDSTPLDLVLLVPEIVALEDVGYIQLLAPILTKAFATNYGPEAVYVASQLSLLGNNPRIPESPSKLTIGRSIGMLLEHIQLDDLSLEQLVQTMQLYAQNHHRSRGQASAVLRTILSREQEDQTANFLKSALQSTFALRMPLPGDVKRAVYDRFRHNISHDTVFILLKFCQVNCIKLSSTHIQEVITASPLHQSVLVTYNDDVILLDCFVEQACLPYLYDLASGKQSWALAPYLVALANARVDIPVDLHDAACDAYLREPRTPWNTIARLCCALIIQGKFDVSHWALVEQMLIKYRQNDIQRHELKHIFLVLSWVFWQRQLAIPKPVMQATTTCLTEIMEQQTTNNKAKESQLQRDITTLLQDLGFFQRLDVESNINGLSVDILAPEERVIFEVDGLTHFVEVPYEDIQPIHRQCTLAHPAECLRHGVVVGLNTMDQDVYFDAIMSGSALITNGQTLLKRQLLDRMGYTVINLPFFLFRTINDRTKWRNILMDTVSQQCKQK